MGSGCFDKYDAERMYREKREIERLMAESEREDAMHRTANPLPSFTGNRQQRRSAARKARKRMTHPLPTTTNPENEHGG
jgi:hypothetical protein